MNELKDIKHDYQFAFSTVIIALVVFVVSGFVLTAGRGIDDPFFISRFIIYSLFGGAGLAYSFGVTLYNYISRRRVLKAIVHEPEEGLLSDLRWARNPFLLFLVTFGVFTLPLFFLGRYSNTFFSAIPFAPQQITTFANIWADSIFPALAENLFIFIPLALVYSFSWKKIKPQGKVLFWSFNLIVIPLMFAFLWAFYHLKVYGSSQASLLATGAFGLIGVLLSMITMSFIPFAVIHFLTNFMLALKKYGLMSSDEILVAVVFFEIVVALLIFFTYKLTKNKART